MAEENNQDLLSENDPFLNFNNTLVLTNLPTITKDKEAKFKTLLERSAAPHNIEQIRIPFDQNGKSKGFAYLKLYAFIYILLFFY